MSFLLGIDLVCADEVEESIAAHGDRYLERIWTEEELRDCSGKKSRLAAAFAAKEAAMKALRAGETAMPWRSIEVTGQSGARPSIAVTGAAADAAERHGARELSVSVATTGRLAAAVVIAESQPEARA
jgi:holo-[acyl-carrier protein] synthase